LHDRIGKKQPAADFGSAINTFAAQSHDQPRHDRHNQPYARHVDKDDERDQSECRLLPRVFHIPPTLRLKRRWANGQG
jgi:hypothetical protein